MANHPLRGKADKLIAEIRRKDTPLSITDLQVFADELLKFQFDEIRASYKNVLDLHKKLSQDIDTLKKFHNFMPSGYVIIDIEGSIIHINNTLCDMLGINKGYAQRHHLTEFLMFENVNKFIYFVRYVLDNKLNVSFETEMIGSNKKYFYAYLRCAPEFDKNGEEYCTIVVQNVTNKKNQEKELITNIENLNQLIFEKNQELDYEQKIRVQTEKELQSTINRLTNLIDNLDVGILLEDENRTVSLVNEKFMSMFEVNQLSRNDLVKVPSREIWNVIRLEAKNFKNFTENTEVMVSNKIPVHNQVFELKSNRKIVHDYIPITENGKTLHLWLFRDN